jgi:hypothetical protein
LCSLKQPSAAEADLSSRLNVRPEQAAENSVSYQGTTLVVPYLPQMTRALAPEVRFFAPVFDFSAACSAELFVQSVFPQPVKAVPFKK